MVVVLDLSDTAVCMLLYTCARNLAATNAVPVPALLELQPLPSQAQRHLPLHLHLQET